MRLLRVHDDHHTDAEVAGRYLEYLEREIEMLRTGCRTTGPSSSITGEAERRPP